MVGIEVIFISFSQPSVFSYLEKRKKKNNQTKTIQRAEDPSGAHIVNKDTYLLSVISESSVDYIFARGL